MAENRIFTIHDPLEIAFQEEEFRKKREANRKTSQEALASGNVNIFPGFSAENFRNEYQFKLEFAPETLEEIERRAVLPLRELAEKYGIKGVNPGFEELPAHTVLDVGLTHGLSVEQRGIAMSGMEANWRFDRIARILAGIEYAYDSVGVNGRDTILYVGDFTPSLAPIHKARNTINYLYEKAGVAPKDFHDIVHSTIGRITQGPEDRSKLLAFSQEVDGTIGRALAASPIQVKVARVYHGTSFAYHNVLNDKQLRRDR